MGSSSDADCGSASSAEGATSCNDDDDYGFSLSDGVYEKGVYVSALRPCSPAAAPGGLQLFDRILQVVERNLSINPVLVSTAARCRYRNSARLSVRPTLNATLIFSFIIIIIIIIVSKKPNRSSYFLWRVICPYSPVVLVFPALYMCAVPTGSH